MNILNSEVEILCQEDGLEGIYRQIEIAGRTCYKSEDKMTEDSAKEFTQKMINSKHWSMLEHGTVYLYIKVEDEETRSYVEFFESNPYSVCKKMWPDDNLFDWYFITTNYRVIIENNKQDALKFSHNKTIEFEPRITVRFTTNIGVTREGNRHRVNSVAEESTNYCNYTKDKFGNEISICPHKDIQDLLPDSVRFGDYDMSRFMSYCGDVSDDADYNWNAIDFYLFSQLASEYAYRNLIRLGWTTRMARGVLPLDTKTTVVYTAFLKDWKHWFDLRYFGTTGKPHPAIREVAEKLYNLFAEQKLL